MAADLLVFIRMLIFLLEGNSKAREPLFWTDRPTDQRLTAEELKCSRNRARRRRRSTNNLLEVWQNSAPFVGGRPIGAAVEALLTKVLNRRSSVSPIVVFYVSACYIAYLIHGGGVRYYESGNDWHKSSCLLPADFLPTSYRLPRFY